MYNQLIDQHDLYAKFVDSSAWDSGIKNINSISPRVADAINQYGIGTKVSDNGQYDFGSGQLIEDLPSSIRNDEEMEEAYDAVCDLAKSYAAFVCGYKA